MVVYFPNAAKVAGTKKVSIVTTIASLAAPKIATEINAASSVEGTLVFRDFKPAVTVNTGNSPARLGTTIQLPQEGNAQFGVIPVAFPFSPNLPDSDASNKMKALLVQGTVLYAVVRRGVDIQTDWTVADRVFTYPVRVGYVDDEQTSGDDEFAEYECHVNLIPIQLPVKVAGVLAA